MKMKMIILGGYFQSFIRNTIYPLGIHDIPTRVLSARMKLEMIILGGGFQSYLQNYYLPLKETRYPDLGTTSENEG